MSAMKTALNGLLVATLAGGATQAMALNAATDARDVTLNEGTIPGTLSPGPTGPVDQLNGNYTEIFTTTSPVPIAGVSTFNTLAYFNATGWTNNGSAVPSFLNSPGAGGYKLYARFQSTGSYTGVPGAITFTGLNGAIELYADPDSDSDPKILPATAQGKTITDVTAGGNTSDDFLLGSANALSFGEGHSFVSGANGDFELIFGNWTLTSTDQQALIPGNQSGSSYFGPTPFYMVLDLNGNFQSFDPSSAIDVLLPNSVANGFFATVPEPASLTLVGLGLLGIGLKRGRQPRR